MARKRYQIFLSSTYEDLKDERFAVMESLHTMKCFVAGMEYFPAIDKDQYEYIKKIIDDCDYYLLILGGRYGSVPSGEDKSYTEKEYDYAVSQGKPVIALLYKNVGELPSNKCETNKEQIKRYNDFREKLKDGRMVDFWRDVSELKSKSLSAVYTAIEEFPDVPGWIRGDSAANEEILQEINMLRKENEELKNSILSHERKCINYLKKEISITFLDNGRRIETNIIVLDTFVVLGMMLHERVVMSKSDIRNFIESQIKDKISKNTDRDLAMISVPAEEIIKIELLWASINLIQKTSPADNSPYTLTELGKRVQSEIFLEIN